MLYIYATDIQWQCLKSIIFSDPVCTDFKTFMFLGASLNILHKYSNDNRNNRNKGWSGEGVKNSNGKRQAQYLPLNYR